LYLSLAIKLKKAKSIFFNSDIINNNFFVLSQIMQNVKLIEYLINRKIINITDINSNDNNLKLNKNKYVQLNERYKINLEKQKDISINNICFKIIYFKSKEDKLIIKLKLLSDNKTQESLINNNNCLYNVITVKITKITKNMSFVFIKSFLDSNYNENKMNTIKKGLKKIFGRIKKLSEISKNNNFSEL
jgi:hypothetical protein